MTPRRWNRALRKHLLVTAACCAVLATLGWSAPALAETGGVPWWRVISNTALTNLQPGKEGQLLLSVTNVGDGNVVATGNTVTVTDNLPPGLEAIEARGSAGSLLKQGSRDAEPAGTIGIPCSVEASKAVCRFEGPKPLFPFVPLEVAVKFKVLPGAQTGSEGEVTVAGGGPPTKTIKQPLVASSSETPFGIASYELNAENEGGSPDVQAGSHPFQLTTSFSMNQRFVTDIYGNISEQFPLVDVTAETPKDFVVRLPPGLVGNATILPRCTEAQFSHSLGLNLNECPASTAVGVSAATLFLPEVFPLQGAPFGGVATATVPVFNLTPAVGEPARFGFDAYGTFVTLDTSVATGEDYAVITSVNNTTELGSLLSSQVTLWGTPSDERHSQSRGWECLQGEQSPFPPCASLGQAQPQPFLALPTSCSQPLRSSVLADSWSEPGRRSEGRPDTSDPRWKRAEFETPALQGCNQVPFTPSISAEPETQSGSTPSGLKVDVHVPQQPSEIPGGVVESDVKATRVTLPQGVMLNPAQANGLLACSEGGVGFTGNSQFEGEPLSLFTPSEQACPEASKVGVVRVKTPLLEHELEGAVYLGQQEANPFGSLLALYIVAKDPVSGVLVKLAGEISLNPSTGQITSTFTDTPQTPFEDFKLEFFGGPTASLTTPAYCGNYTTTAVFTPWSGTGDVTSASSFPITSNCTQPGAAQPFSPSFQTGSSSNQAGGFTPFTLTITNPDGDQALTGVTEHLPSGLAAMISSVTPCPEPQAALNQCGPDSLIGHSTAEAGLGGSPYSLPGAVYLTGPYKGAPFGLSVVTAANAGPFHLGDVTVRSTINIDPSTAAVTVTSDPFPTFTSTPEHPNTGIPTQLKQINVTIDRPGFQFNPTNCTPTAITGTLSGAQGASVPVASPFQVTNCANLPFKPTFTASTQGNASKANGASFKVVVTSGKGQANIGKTDLTIPAALPSRLTTIQKACRAQIFEANPATCPEGSNIGTATVHTPVLKNVLTGPAYLVSHGAAKFPDVEFVLQGEGITLVLDGQTDIKKDVTYSRFETLPDAPVSRFETTLPEGPHSALTSNVPASKKFNLCGTKLIMPTVITGQNGAVIKQNTKIAVTGCKPTSRVALLRAALKACRKKHNARKRHACERQARKRYGAKAAGKKHKKKK
jgi:hypothetical protein